MWGRWRKRWGRWAGRHRRRGHRVADGMAGNAQQHGHSIAAESWRPCWGWFKAMATHRVEIGEVGGAAVGLGAVVAVLLRAGKKRRENRIDWQDDATSHG